jgi:hypothetical protein
MKILENDEDSMNQEIQTMVKVVVEAKGEEEINNTLEDHKIKEVKTCLKSSASMSSCWACCRRAQNTK